MVGVMICKCEPPKSFAAMSGTYALPKFTEVAKAAGVDVVINTGSPPDTARQLRPGDYASANASGINPTRIANRVEAAWRKAANAQDAGDPQYSYPGICAGAHLLARSGHAPAQMTEMFFAPKKPWDKKYDWNVFREKILDGVKTLVESGTSARGFTSNAAKAKDQEEASPWGLTVASCKTCQELLPLTMCPVRKCP
jgi:hypothetical protein